MRQEVARALYTLQVTAVETLAGVTDAAAGGRPLGPGEEDQV